QIAGIDVPLLSALPYLASISANQLPLLPPSLGVWSLAAKLALDLVARERVVPRILQQTKITEARSCISLNLRDDYDRFILLAKSFPLAAHAVPIATPRKRTVRVKIWTAEALLRVFLDIVADVLVRATPLDSTPKENSSWAQRLCEALHGKVANFAAEGFQERSLFDELETWVQPISGTDTGAPRACFRLELPDVKEDKPKFFLRFLLQAADDPSLLAKAEDIFTARKKVLAHIHCSARVAEEKLLQGLSIAARIFAPIERSLHEARPEGIELNIEGAWQFLSSAAPALSEAGMTVIVPAELTPKGQRRLRMRMRIGGSKSGGASNSVISMREALSFSWDARIGNETLTLRKLKELAALKAPLVRYRGQWVAVDQTELEQATRLLAEGGGTLTATAALAAALGETVERGESGIPVEVAVEGQLENVLAQLRAPACESVEKPYDFHGDLRPYQERGLAWLAQMSSIGLGACLADDMGLGKTIQLLAFLLHRRATNKEDTRPILLICPTSVIGNWQRELQKFAPTLNMVQH
ncbi:MAG TPA: SNF2 helicase-associated domain-containing protein, partial [Steroidobacteraceae bacterium]|nr:SNF2 helicase-associated domain-containing protein [Steroidobacteraceae bacterium]